MSSPVETSPFKRILNNALERYREEIKTLFRSNISLILQQAEKIFSFRENNVFLADFNLEDNLFSFSLTISFSKKYHLPVIYVWIEDKEEKVLLEEEVSLEEVLKEGLEKKIENILFSLLKQINYCKMTINDYHEILRDIRKAQNA